MNIRPQIRCRLASVAALLLLFVAGHAFAKDNWVRVQSKNFMVVSNAGQGESKKVITKLEQFRTALSVIFPKVRLDTPVPTLVILFKSSDDFRPFKPRVKGKIQEEVGGYFLTRSHANYIVLASDNPGASTYEIIFHEYEHYILHSNSNRLPVWLDEGLAEFFSSFEVSDNNLKASLGNPIARHVYYLRDTSLVPLKTLITVDRKSPYYNEGRKAGTFYAESWALIHYFMLSDEGKRRPQLQQFMVSLSEDRPIEELFKRAFQQDFKQLEGQLQSYVNRRLFPVLNVSFNEKLAVEQQLNVTPLSEAEGQYSLGDLLMQMGRPKEASKYLEKSLTLDPKLSLAESSLAMVRASEEKFDEAKQLLESAITHDGNNYLAHYHLSGLLLLNKEYDAAIKEGREAVRVKPEMSFLYLGLGYTYRRANKDVEAINTFEEGLGRNPRESNFYRALAFLWLERNQGKLAVDNAIGYLRLKGWQEDSSPYMALARYFGLRQAKRDEDAQKTLVEAAEQLNANEWPYPVIRYLQRTISVMELISAAGIDRDQLTEAHAYVGLELSANGEREAALEHLNWVKEKGNQSFVEYPLALSEIARLQGSTASAP